MWKLLVIVFLSFQLRLCSGQASPNETLASALSQICAKNKTGSAETTTTTAAPPASTAPATEAPATEAPATEAPATEAPATEAPASSDAPESGNSDDLECKVNSIVDYLLNLKIKDGNFRKYLKKDKKSKFCQLLTPKCMDFGSISQEVKNSFVNTMSTYGTKAKESSSINIKMSTTLWVVIVMYRIMKWK